MTGPFAPFTTADLCDAHPAQVRVAEPLFRDYGGARRFAGPIETLKVRDDNALVSTMLEGEGGGRVLVVDGGGSLRCALVGGRLAALARQNGWAGIVVHGCIRDSAELGATPLGVKALAASPRKSGKQGSGQRGVRLRFAGVEWIPGQFAYADEDGVVVAERELGPA